MAAPPRAARKKMDRSWIRGVTKFSKPHVDGVREFMRFVSERFDKNEQILCPCCKCLNHIRKHQRDVEDHLYIHGMACTYDKWIYHGESLDAGINENVRHLDALSRRQASGSLYESGDAEDIEQGIVDKGSEKVPSNTLTRNVTMPSGGKVSKRVVALEEEDQPARMTRQRTGELASTEEDHHERTTIPQEGSAEDATVAYNCSTQLEDQNQMCNEGQPNAMAHGRNRGRRGKDLDRITQGLGAKFPVHIAEGKKRPEVPMQAAKFASQGGIVFKQHMPILPSWDGYKENPTLVADFTNKVIGQFAMDTTNKTATDACADMLQSQQRQMRHMLKEKYFNGVPANQVRTTSPVRCMTDEEWMELVELWSSPEHKARCLQNKQNRQKVQNPARTGSRSHIAHCHALKQAKHKEATAITEAMMAEPAPEGQVPKSPKASSSRS